MVMTMGTGTRRATIGLTVASHRTMGMGMGMALIDTGIGNTHPITGTESMINMVYAACSAAGLAKDSARRLLQPLPPPPLSPPG